MNKCITHIWIASLAIVPLSCQQMPTTLLTTSTAGKCVLAAAGNTQYTIATNVNGTEAELFAAQELSTYLKKATGAEFKIINEKEFQEGSKGIYVGWTEYAKTQGIDHAALGAEEWVIRGAKDGNLIISGGRPRGTIYGVHSFLENYAGCRWLDQKTEFVPSIPCLEFDANVDVKEKPAFQFRGFAAPYVNPEAFKLFYHRNKYNGAYLGAREGFAFRYGSPYRGAHTFYQYTKDWPSEYDSYFALGTNGKRPRATSMEGPGQVCLTTPAVRRLFIGKLREFIKLDKENAQKNGYPPPLIYMLGHNDNEGKCVCPSCQAMAEKYGGYGGVMVDFTNEIADDIRKDFPEICIAMMAYTYTQEPPKDIKPRDNVIVEIALLGREFGTNRDILRPYSHHNNKESLRIIEGWGKIAKHIAVYDYLIIYKAASLFPYVNHALPQNMKLYSDMRATGIYIDGMNEGNSFSALQRWLALKLMTNPNRAVEPLVTDFIRCYYGKAAPAMKDYWDYLEMRMKEEPKDMAGLSPGKIKYLDREFFLKAEELLNRAEDSVKGDTNLLFHIARERIPVDSALLNKWQSMEKQLANGDQMPFDKEAIVKRCRGNVFALIEYCHPPAKWDGLKAVENGKIEALLISAPLPDQFKDIDNVVDILSPRFQYYSGYPATLVNDEDSVCKKAFKLGSSHADTKDAEFHKKPLECGLYYREKKEFGPHIKIAQDQLPSDGKYHFHKVGQMDLSTRVDLWVHWSWKMGHCFAVEPPPGNKYDVYISLKLQGPAYMPNSKDENAILMDRIILVPIRD